MFSCNTPNTDTKNTDTEKFISQSKTIPANKENLGLDATSVTSSNNSVATAILENNVITITSLSEGNTTVTPSDGVHSATISVTVSNLGNITVNISKYETIFYSKTTTVSADKDTLGLNATSVTSSNSLVATATLENNVITITSLSEGNTTITASDGVHSATISVTVSELGNMNLVISKYTERTVTVRFKIDSKGRFDDNTYGTKSISGISGTPMTNIPNVTAKEGYELAWWSPEIPENFPDTDTTYTAVFSEATYTITYHLNGGSVNGENPSSFIWGTSYINLIAPSKVGYTFSGWSYTNEGVSSSMTEKVYVNNINNIKDKTLNLYALWKPNTYYIVMTPHASSGYCYARVLYNSNTLSFYNYMYTSTAADATKYSNVEFSYTPLADDKYDGWQAVCKNSEGNIWDDLDETNYFKLLDNSGNLIKNIENVTDENGNWIATCNYEVKRINK